MQIDEIQEVLPPSPSPLPTTITNKNLIVEVILKHILDDDLAFPKWVGNNFNQYNLNNNKLISPPEDMIHTLKHIPMPIGITITHYCYHYHHYHHHYHHYHYHHHHYHHHHHISFKCISRI